MVDMIGHQENQQLLEVMKQDDKDTIDEILTTIRDQLEALAHLPKLLHDTARARFPGPWSQIYDAIERGREDLRGADWNDLRDLGLTGFSLAFDRDLLWSDLGVGGTLLSFFKRVDALLGSMSIVSRSLHQVNTYAKNLGACVMDLAAVYRSTEDMWTPDNEIEFRTPSLPTKR
jgi:hypothetical protein